jgi:hypothetical protein
MRATPRTETLCADEAAFGSFNIFRRTVVPALLYWLAWTPLSPAWSDGSTALSNRREGHQVANAHSTIVDIDDRQLGCIY